MIPILQLDCGCFLCHNIWLNYTVVTILNHGVETYYQNFIIHIFTLVVLNLYQTWKCISMLRGHRYLKSCQMEDEDQFILYN